MMTRIILISSFSLISFISYGQSSELHKLLETNKIESSFHSSNHESFDNDFFTLPHDGVRVFPSVVLINSRIDKKAFDTTQWKMYSVNYWFENKGDKDWNLDSLKAEINIYSFNSDQKVKSTSFGNDDNKLHHPNGFVSHTNYFSDLNLWSAAFPHLYRMEIHYNTSFPTYSGYYLRNFGIRSVKVLRTKEIAINEQIEELFTVELPIDGLDSSEIIQDLQNIKASYVNTVILNGLIPKAVLVWCDQNGLYIINHLSNSDFNNFKDFYQYLMTCQTSPSLIIWEVEDEFQFNEELASIDSSRLILETVNTAFDFGDWTKFSPSHQQYIKSFLSSYQD